MNVVCGKNVYGRNEGKIVGVGKTASVKSVCGRPAVSAARAVKEREDGSIFLGTWEFRCARHWDPTWEPTMRRWYPRLGKRAIVANLADQG